MASPVKNWKSNVGETPIFGDIADDSLRYYGPRAIWREFSRRNIGTSKLILSGVIDLGYSTNELQALSTELGGRRISPLSISGVASEPSLSISIEPPHTGGLTPLNSLPFPQYRLSITIDRQAADAGTLTTAIEDGWATRTLLDGRYSYSADGVNAIAGYKVVIDAKGCISDIGTEHREFSTTGAWNAVEASVLRNLDRWIVYYGGREDASERNVAIAALVEILVARCFEEQVLVRYDNGLTATGKRLRDGLTLGGADNRIFVLSSPAKITAEIAF